MRFLPVASKNDIFDLNKCHSRARWQSDIGNLEINLGVKMEEVKKCACGMPLDDKTECKCKPEVCIHCCECEDDCSCGCAAKAEEDLEDDEEGGCCSCGSCDKGCGADKAEDEK